MFVVACTEFARDLSDLSKGFRHEKAYASVVPDLTKRMLAGWKDARPEGSG
jgi:hypothetical protein